MISKEEYLCKLHNEMMFTLSSLASAGKMGVAYNQYLELLFTIWGKYSHKVLIDDMSDNGLVGDEYQTPLYEIGDLDKEFEDIRLSISKLKVYNNSCNE